MASFVRSRRGTIHVVGRFDKRYCRSTWCGFNADAYQMTEILSVYLDDPKNKRVCKECFEWLKHLYIALRDAPSNNEIKLTRTWLAFTEVDSPDVPDVVPSDV